MLLLELHALLLEPPVLMHYVCITISTLVLPDIFLSHTNAHVLDLTGNHISCNRVDVTEQQPLKLVDLNFQAPSVLGNDRGTVTLQK